ncbi:MAG: hypothetical protein ACK518_03805 [bacterium]|jgi:hypothetical protein
MKFICAQPAIPYYTWQVEVMINNFIKNGINPNDIHILGAIYNNLVPEDWRKLAEAYKDVCFFFYKDSRTDTSYIPSIYFNMMKQHLQANPQLEKEALFLHDSDIIFTRPVNFNDMENDDVWYLSDTVGYIGTQYILTKGENVYLGMCDVIGIDPSIPKERNADSGGAQHIVKNTTAEYWDKVEKDSIKLYAHFCQQEPHYKGEGYPIQKWTAGMWSLLWNAWKFGHTTKVDKRLGFCWATCPIYRWGQVSIFHNAGVTEDRKDLFFKAAYINKLPYNEIKLENVSNKFCSYKYAEELLKTKEISCLI